MAVRARLAREVALEATVESIFAADDFGHEHFYQSAVSVSLAALISAL
jgi:hypothetical protein